MQARHIFWLLAAAAIVVVAAAAWTGRRWLDEWTHDRLATKYAAVVAGLPEKRAAEFVARLADDDSQPLELVVQALADRRPDVEEAAEAGLLRGLDRWAKLPAAESSPHVATLAELLAQVSPQLPAERRLFAQSLAERILAWPIDRARVDPARLIADCEVVLRLDPPEPPAIRLAAVPDSSAIAERAPPPVADAPPATALPPILAAPPRPPIEPRAIQSVEPAPLPGGGHEAPLEPRRLLPPRGVRISDEAASP
jgi:hypothetical protein